MGVGNRVTQACRGSSARSERNPTSGSRERFAQQWATMRAERRADEHPVSIAAGESNYARGQVPYGVDLAAAWSWRFLVHHRRRLRRDPGHREVLRGRAAARDRAAADRPGRPGGQRPGPARPSRAGCRALLVVLGSIGDRGAAAHLRRPADRPGRQRPLQAGGDRPRADPGLAQDRPAARQRQPDQRLPQVRPGRGDHLEHAGRHPADRGRHRARPHRRGRSSSSCSRPTSSSPTATGSGPGWCGSSRARPRAPAPTPRAGSPGPR